MSMYWAALVVSVPFAGWLVSLVPTMILPTAIAAVASYFYARWLSGIGGNDRR